MDPSVTEGTAGVGGRVGVSAGVAGRQAERRREKIPTQRTARTPVAPGRLSCAEGLKIPRSISPPGKSGLFLWLFFFLGLGFVLGGSFLLFGLGLLLLSLLRRFFGLVSRLLFGLGF